MSKKTKLNLAAANFSAQEAGLYLAAAAQATIDGKAQIDAGKAQGAAALAVIVAGFTSDEIALKEWAFDIQGKAEGDIHHHVQCTGYDEFGGSEGAWRYNSEGAVSQIAQTVFKDSFTHAFFNLPKSIPALWTQINLAVPIARALRAEGMTASIEQGKLKVEGGSGETADKLREAKSLRALAKIAKGEEGTGRASPQNSKGGSDDVTEASPSEICAAAAILARKVAKGEEAICNAALSSLRAIAALVAKHPEAFAD